MHNCVDNKLKKSARQHTIAVHDNCVIIVAENDLSNILKSESVLLPIVPVSPLLIRDNDVSIIIRDGMNRNMNHLSYKNITLKT